jgi:hypothetical protein
MADPPNDLEVLAVLMMDVRATVESMRRSITNTQSSIEQFRHTHGRAQLDDIKECLEQLVEECAVVTEAATEAGKPIAKLERLAQEGKPTSGEYRDRRKNPRDDDGT